MNEQQLEAQHNGRTWRWWVLPAVVRAGVAVGFTATPAVEQRVDDAALVVVCVVLALAVWTAFGLDWYTRRIADRVDLAVDGLTVLVLVPLVGLGGGLQVADGRFGGRLESVLAAFFAALLIIMALLLIARAGPVRWPGAPALALLPAALSTAVVFGGPGLFTTSRMWQGISLAWMVAALITFLSGVIAARNRTSLAVIGYIALALFVFVWSSTSEGPNINAAANTVSVIVVALIGVILASSTMDWPSPAQARRTRSAPDPER